MKITPKIEKILYEMAQDYGTEPLPVSPKLKSDLKKANFDIAQVLGTATPEQIDYLETIASDEYKHLVQKLSRYGKKGEAVTNRDAPKLMYAAINAVKNISSIEAKHKEQLEHLAIESLRQLPEFTDFIRAYDEGNISVSFEWIPLAGLQPQAPKEDDSNLTPEEKMNKEVFEAINGIDEERLKRVVANYITQGSAVVNTFSFEMVKPELDRIDPKLTELYGVLMSVSFLSYWMNYGGFDYSQGGQAQLGEEQVNESEATIHVKGICFPVMLHELIKGIMEFVSSRSMSGNDDVRKRVLDSEHVGDEEAQLAVGPSVYRAFIKKIPPADRKLTMQILHKLLTLGDDATDSFRDVMTELLTTNQSQKFIRMINDLKNEIEDYDRSELDF